jgi:L-lactate utilization protein LutC
MEQTKQKYEVYATVTLPVSFDIESTSEEKAKETIQEICERLNLVEVILQLKSLDGKYHLPYVHDWDFEIGRVFED